MGSPACRQATPAKQLVYAGARKRRSVARQAPSPSQRAADPGSAAPDRSDGSNAGQSGRRPSPGRLAKIAVAEPALRAWLAELASQWNQALGLRFGTLGVMTSGWSRWGRREPRLPCPGGGAEGAAIGETRTHRDMAQRGVKMGPATSSKSQRHSSGLGSQALGAVASAR